jgi:hypothetical protein
VDKDGLRDYAEDALSPAELESLKASVGMEWDFDPRNPTGHYRADLEQEVSLPSNTHVYCIQP